MKAQIDENLVQQLQSLLDARVESYGNNGVSACLIMPNGDLWQGTAGVGAMDLAMTDTTVFHGASTTKMNIATLVLLMAQDGLIYLNQTWDYYLNLNVDFDPAITVRQLLSNTSGIKDYLETSTAGDLITADFNHAFTPTEILENVVDGTPDFAAGTDFHYSTSNYVLAAMIAESVSSNSLEEELRTRIWTPLGMHHTYFGGFESYAEPTSGVWWDFGSGVMNYSAVSQTSMLTFGYGGANIVSTPTDLAKFVRAVVSGGFLSESSMTEMLTFSSWSYGDWPAGYGLGIHNAYAFGENSVLGHDGYYTNMTDMFHSLDYGFTLVTMTNTQTSWFAIFNEMYEVISESITEQVEQTESAVSLELFPNPTSGLITLVSNKGNGFIGSVCVFDALGKLVYTTTNDQNNARLVVNLNALGSGIYTMEVITITGVRFTRRLSLLN
ncbi:MAG: serine hydrolase [Flavobacteriales bacterium]